MKREVQAAGHVLPGRACKCVEHRWQGSREGKIVLAQLHDATDPEGGGSYTVKRYHSEKVAEDGEWRHSRVVLQSVNGAIEDIELAPGQDVDVFAEFGTVLIPGASALEPAQG